MKRMGLIKRALLLAMCGMMAVPAAMAAWEPVTAKAAVTDSDVQDIAKEKENAKNALDDHYDLKEPSIPADKREAAKNARNAAKTKIDACRTIEGISNQLAAGKANIDSYIPSDSEPDPEPTTSNSNIMVGGNWVTPVANGGQQVSVVLPVVNMGRRRVKNAVVTPQISEDPAKWPFEIETSNYTQTIDRLPGTDEGGDDMERRRELTWVLRTRKDAPGGYMPISFDVTYENDDKSLTTVTLTTYVNVKGTTGVSSDGTASTPRVIVTGFTTSPEVVQAGETFTLTRHI